MASSSRGLDIDWDLCIICQQEGRKDKRNTCPANSKRGDKGAGYTTFIQDVQAYNVVCDKSTRFNKLE